VIRASGLAPLVATGVAALALAACGGDDEPAADDTGGATTPEAAAAPQLDGVKDYLLDHTEQLTGFTAEFKSAAEEYHALAEETGFDYEALWSEHGEDLAPMLEEMKADWIEGNPVLRAAGRACWRREPPSSSCLGSYFAPEQLRARRRRAILDKPLAETSS
jgi:hypothetical protein